MSGMTDARALDFIRVYLAPYSAHGEKDQVVEHIAARLRGDGEQGQAVAWSEMLSAIGMAKMSLMKDAPDVEKALRMLGTVSASLDAILSAAPATPCADAGALCIDCTPRNPDGSCPDAAPAPVGGAR